MLQSLWVCYLFVQDTELRKVELPLLCLILNWKIWICIYFMRIRSQCSFPMQTWILAKNTSLKDWVLMSQATVSDVLQLFSGGLVRSSDERKQAGCWSWWSRSGSCWTQKVRMERKRNLSKLAAAFGTIPAKEYLLRIRGVLKDEV